MDWLGLKEEHKMLRHDLKRFAEAELEPTLLELDRESRPHVEAFGKLGKLGILGLLIPEQHGGAEMDLLSLVVTVEQLAQVSPSFALSVAAHNLAGDIIATYGPDALKARYLPELAGGRKIAGLGIETMLHPAGREKRGKFIINGSFAHLIVYRAEDEKETAFAIEEPASERDADIELMGMRASGICRYVPEAKSGQRSTFTIDDAGGALSKQRLLLAAVSCGICGSALAHSITYAKERKQFDRPIASFGMVRIMLAEMAARTNASRMLLYLASENGSSLDRDLSAAFAVEHAQVVTDHGVQVYGGYGYTKDYPLEMFFRDAKVLEVFAGSAEYLKTRIGAQLTG